MTPPRFGVLVLLGTLIVLAPLAQASPPDQPWLGGFYDDGDYDDVVLLVTGALHAVQGVPFQELLPVSEVATLVLPIPPAAPREPVAFLEAGRAPPHA